MSGAPVGEGGGGGSDGADLDRLAGLLGVWAADAAARDAAGSRARQRWLAEQAGAEATLVGALVDLAEAAATCELRTAAASFTGRIEAVGRDFCVVGPAGADVPAGRSPGRPAGGWSATAAGGWPATGEGSAAGERTVVALGAVVAVHPAGPPPPSPARHLVSGA
ncbi:MAG TPA: hypothetical protein VFP61_14035, partial [Acidimicrobiales bacterium]|nr:hypothetical protein [Acidimicrobiales bacterium]